MITNKVTTMKSLYHNNKILRRKVIRAEIKGQL